MRWFRLRQKWGSYLALAALLTQLVLTFGHVHLDRWDRHSGDVTIAAVADHPQTPGTPEAPDRDHCATCILLHLAQSLVSPGAPALLPPPAMLGHDQFIATTPYLSNSTPARFQARAPPIA